MNELRLEIDKETAKGQYANLALIAHNRNEFFLDFVLMQPQQGSAMVASRIIVSPSHAKALLRSLAENLQRYEDNFGLIPENTEPQNIQPSGQA
jgi:hypothetical protein